MTTFILNTDSVTTSPGFTNTVSIEFDANDDDVLKQISIDSLTGTYGVEELLKTIHDYNGRAIINFVYELTEQEKTMQINFKAAGLDFMAEVNYSPVIKWRLVKLLRNLNRI